MKNFHVPLPVDLYSKLRALADDYGRPATELAREAIEAWLQERRREALHGAIAEYAEKSVGTEADLDPGLEAAAVEHLLQEDG